MTSIDISAIAADLASHDGSIRPTGPTAKTGGLLLAEHIEHIIDGAALAGAFADLADRPSIEVSTLTHTDRTVWICLEFDHDQHLLRTGPVPVSELAQTNLNHADDIAALFRRVRHLMSTAVLLDTPATRSNLLGVRARTSRSGPPRLSVAGLALDEAVLEAVRNTCLDSYDNPAGDSMRLGAALAAVRGNPLSKAQAYGTDPIPDRIEALWQQAEEAEMDIAAQHLPASLDLPMYAASNLVGAFINAIANPTAGPAVDVEGPVAVTCRKRRETCYELVASAAHAQHFVFERAEEMSHPDAVQTRMWIDAIHAEVVRATETALLLSNLAETAERHDEPLSARAADTEADRHVQKAERTVANAWFAAAEALQATESGRSRTKVFAEWERRTGWEFAGGLRPCDSTA
ncbi:hypothetical protein KGQ20_04200 [Catenulispora sp. NF23]|uniref:Uncharacterized protein n=1 Tax=Catenulispora pinistramenti TaxID=2705254 RepID=A0ABS5KIL0_9ACTN|nr:hypothetical protein [Catenulispora pinistramenti]MBS2531966.1 hypothetical protein [Catenulispora pinistramenti]MBS2546234.1 hypothetical protein [Catenulispora pinistramenti]